jgi:hypothetical protein
MRIRCEKKAFVWISGVSFKGGRDRPSFLFHTSFKYLLGNQFSLRGNRVKTKIGEMAGRVWRALGEKEAVAVSRFLQILKEKGEIVYQALG